MFRLSDCGLYIIDFSKIFRMRTPFSPSFNQGTNNIEKGRWKDCLEYPIVLTRVEEYQESEMSGYEIVWTEITRL